MNARLPTCVRGWLNGWWTGWLLALVCMLGGLALPGHTLAAVQDLREAELTVRLRGNPTPIVSTATLPLHWDVTLRRQAGWARVRLRFDAAPVGDGVPQALFIGRVGNAYRVSLNGTPLAEGGSLSEPNDGWSGKRPLWIRLPGPLLQTHNVLDIEIRADVLRRAGVSTVQVGPEAELHAAWHAREWRDVTLPRVASIFSLLVSAFCLLLWWQQREALYAIAALWQAVWCLRVTVRWWEDAFLSWPSWFQLMQCLFWLGCVAGYGLVRAVWGTRPIGEQRVGAAVLLAWLLATWGGADWVLATTVVLIAAWAVLCVRLVRDTWQAWRIGPDRLPLQAWMTLAVGVCWAALVHDIVKARLLPLRFDEPGWTIAAAALTGVAVLAIVSLRFQATRHQLSDLTHSLERRVRLREAELAARHEELRRLERIGVKAEERARILRDMHDGAGAHLITAMRQIEGGVASKADVLQTLRESLDQLRLSVDAMSLPTGDVNALLASLRFRLQPRIQSAGLALHWNVDLLPLWRDCSEESMHHLQHILFEAFSNTLQHARAANLTLAAHADAGHIVIDLQDDGIGFSGTGGNGMRTMHERAALAGAELLMRSSAQGSNVRITLPA